MTIGGRRYVDGGIRSGDNADLASRHGRIVVLSPLGPDSPFPTPLPLRAVVARLRSEGSEVTVIGTGANGPAGELTGARVSRLPVGRAAWAWRPRRW